MGTLDVHVFDRDGTTRIAGPIADVLACSGLEELDGLGGGSLTIAVDNPTLVASPTLLDYRNVVKLVVDGTARAAFVINKKAETVVGAGADASRAIEVSGPGLLSWLRDAVVYAKFPRPYSGKTRWFNWASESGTWLTSTASQWGPVTRVRQRGGSDLTDPASPWRNAPLNWCNATTLPYWVWDRSTAWTTAPNGVCYVRRPFTVGAAGQYRLFFTGDNAVSVMVDGGPLCKTVEYDAWKRTYSADIALGAGNHVLGFKVRNVGGPAGLLWWLASMDAGTGALTEVAGSGLSGEEVINAYPTVPPGWTFGEILDTLVDEAVARGVDSVDALTVGFSATADTDSTTWTRQLPVSVQVGQDYWAVCEELRDLGLDVAVNPATLTFNAYEGRGSSKTSVVIDAAAHIQSLTEDVETALANALLVETADHWATTKDTASVTNNGRIEAYLDATSLDSSSAATVAMAVLQRYAVPAEAVTVSYAPTTGVNVPWTNFNCGDTVTVSTASGGTTTRVVVSIAVALGDNGEPVYTVELDSVARDLLESLRRIIDRRGVQDASPATAAGDVVDGGVGDYTPEDDWGTSDLPFDDLADYPWISAGPALNPEGTPWLPPDDPSGGSEEVMDVGAVCANAALDPAAYFGVVDFEVALCSSVPPVTSGTWASLTSYELTVGAAPGYARATLAAADVAAPVYSSGYVSMASEAAVTFAPNTAPSASWPPVVAVAFVVNGGPLDNEIVAVINLSTPLDIGPSEAAQFAAGDIVFAHAAAS